MQHARKHVHNALKGAATFKVFNSSLQSIIRVQRLSRRSVVTTAVHLISEKDDLKLCEALLRDMTIDECKAACNTKMGRHGYTPIFRAAYRGSIRMLKLLVGYGADVCMTNAHGETVMNTLDAGQTQQVSTMPQHKMFIDSRFEECKTFVAAHERMQKNITPTKPRVFKPRVPRKILKAATIIERWWRQNKHKVASA